MKEKIIQRLETFGLQQLPDSVMDAFVADCESRVAKATDKIIQTRVTPVTAAKLVRSCGTQKIKVRRTRAQIPADTGTQTP